MRFLLNTLISALIIATVAEVGKRSSFLAALLVALPLTSILALSFLYWETGDGEKVAALSLGIFWLVLPTLLSFAPSAIAAQEVMSFGAALPASMIALVAVFFGYAWALKKIGVSISTSKLSG